MHSEGQRQRSIAAAAVDAAVPVPRGHPPARLGGCPAGARVKATAQSGKKRAAEGGGGGGAALKQARNARKAAAEEARNAADADDGDEQQDDALAQRTNALSERERTATTKTIRCRRGQPGAPGILARCGPDGVELLPYAHQWDGVDACFRQKVMLLMYAAGLGKTAIVFLLQAALEQAKLDAQNKHIGGVKIVCVVPAGLVKNQWEETAHCWLKTRGRTATVDPLSIVTVQSAKDVTRELIDRVRVLIITKEVLTLLFKKCYKRWSAASRMRTIAGAPSGCARRACRCRPSLVATRRSTWSAAMSTRATALRPSGICLPLTRCTRCATRTRWRAPRARSCRSPRGSVLA